MKIQITKRDWIEKVIYPFICFMVASIIVFIAFQWSLFGWDPERFKNAFFVSKGMTGISLVVLFMTYWLIYFITDEVATTTIGLTFTYIIIAVISYFKIQFRNEPFFPSDFSYVKNMGDLTDMVSMQQIFVLLGIIALMVVLIYVVRKVEKKYIRKERIFHKSTQNYITRGVFVGLLLIFFLQVGKFNSTDSFIYTLAQSRGFSYNTWNQLQVYRENNFVLGYLVNLPTESMEKPADYSFETMQTIYDKYNTKATLINESRTTDDYSDITVIGILSESLSDPSELKTILDIESPLEFITNPTEKIATGFTIIPAYGGGTTNSEFEELTSLSVATVNPQISNVFQDVVSQYNYFPSFVEFYKQSGNEAVAMHSYNSNFYKRRHAYSSFGFDKMIFENEYTHTERDTYIRDSETYQEILDLLDSNTENKFIHMVTMQNHSWYEGRYEETVSDIENTGYPLIDAHINDYMTGITLTDVSTANFIETLSKREEKIILVLYGDHLPGIYTEAEGEIEKVDMHKTNYFIYANFDVALEEKPNEKISLTSLYPLINEVASIKTNAYYTVVDTFREHFPYNIGRVYYTQDGTALTYDDMSSEEQQLFDEYTLFQYDIMAGKRYFLGFMTP